MRTLLSTIGLTIGLACAPFAANAGDILDPTPVAQQSGGPAVDGVNYKLAIVGGGFDRNVLDTAGNMMFVGSVATPIPYLPPQYGAQLQHRYVLRAQDRHNPNRRKSPIDQR